MERSNGKVAALFSETYEGDEDDTLNNGASQLARSRCFSFFFFFACERIPSSRGCFYPLRSEEREMQAKFKFTPGPGFAFSAIARKNEIDEIHPFDIISSLYRLISNTYSTPLGHPVDIAIKSR